MESLWGSARNGCPILSFWTEAGALVRGASLSESLWRTRSSTGSTRARSSPRRQSTARGYRLGTHLAPCLPTRLSWSILSLLRKTPLLRTSSPRWAGARNSAAARGTSVRTAEPHEHARAVLLYLPALGKVAVERTVGRPAQQRRRRPQHVDQLGKEGIARDEQFSQLGREIVVEIIDVLPAKA